MRLTAALLFVTRSDFLSPAQRLIARVKSNILRVLPKRTANFSQARLFGLQYFSESQNSKKISLDERSFGYILAAIICPGLSIESGISYEYYSPLFLCVVEVHSPLVFDLPGEAMLGDGSTVTISPRFQSRERSAYETNYHISNVGCSRRRLLRS